MSDAVEHIPQADEVRNYNDKLNKINFSVGEALLKHFRSCCNKSFLLVAAKQKFPGLIFSDTDDVAELYFSNPYISALDPNPVFDEAWYRLNNQDVLAAIEKGDVYSGFSHYLTFGIFEGRWPNAAMAARAVPTDRARPYLDIIDEPAYRGRYKAVNEFLKYFPILTPLQHYNLFGRNMGLTTTDDIADTINFDMISKEFDPEYYTERYLKGGDLRFLKDPFGHYLVVGVQNAHSPNATFDESWYRAFYGEIREAIERGEILCGFYHYIASGRREGRIPKFDRKLALEAKVPGVTQPVLANRISEIQGRLRCPNFVIEDMVPRRLWFLLPTINPDISFGGYRCVLELMHSAHKSGYKVGIICTEDGEANKEYFIWRDGPQKFKNLLKEIQIITGHTTDCLKIGSRDILVAYSLWDLYLADRIRKASSRISVILLTQEFEPIFHDYSSTRAILEEAYRIPHFPLINSRMLLNFLKTHRVGMFDTKKGKKLREGEDYAVFEHRINIFAAQTEESISVRKERVLVAYARPENHAARNMFEILVMALRQVCAEEVFGSEWSFIGLGALTDVEPVPLGGGHQLVLHAKMTEEEYIRYISVMDIGVSLMYAPHPSVVPFEFATTGSLVVTNTFENRSAAELKAISANIIARRPSVEGIADALRAAVARVKDAESRVANIYRPEKTNWEDIFSAAFLKQFFGEIEEKQLSN